MKKQKYQEGTCRGVVVNELDPSQNPIAKTHWYASGAAMALSAGRDLAARRGLLIAELGGPYIVVEEYA
jgi:hypothetical protein